MRYISVFSGIEAASVAWEQLGWEPVAFSEIDAFPSAVLAKRFPNVPNLGDITKVDWSPYRGAVDVVVGGSPCQSFSIAGKREGLAGASGLMWEYIRCVQEVMPSWLVWENVPGALTSERGRAFAQLLDSLDELGYGLAWRILDAQFVRVPGRGGWIGPVAQRRRRVFLVGHLGDMRACEVLFEPESLRWDNPSSREKRKALARAVGRGSTTGSLEVSGSDSDCLTPWDPQAKRIFTEDSCCPTLNSGADTNNTHIQPTVLQSVGINTDATYSLTTAHTQQNGRPYSEGIAQTLDTTGPPSCVYLAGFCGYASHTSQSIGYEDEQSPTLKGNDWQSQVPDVVTQHNEDFARTLTAEFDSSPCIDRGSNVVFDSRSTYAVRTANTGANGCGVSEECAHTVDTTGPEATAYAFKVRCGGGEYVKWDGSRGTAGRGALCDDQTAYTVAATQDQYLCVQEPMVLATLQAHTEIGVGGVCPTITAHAKKEPLTLVMEVQEEQESDG